MIYSVKGKGVIAILISKSKTRKRQNYSSQKQMSGYQGRVGREGWRGDTREILGPEDFHMIL